MLPSAVASARPSWELCRSLCGTPRLLTALCWIFAVSSWIASPAAAIELSGQVTDADGEPISGAVVQVTTEAGNTAGLAATGPDGRWLIETVTGDRFLLRSAAPGFVTIDWPQQPCAPVVCNNAQGAVLDTGGVDRGDLDFALPPEATLEGAVVANESQAPLQVASVRTFDSLDRVAAISIVVDGAFQVSGLPAGSYRLEATANGRVAQLFDGVDCVAPLVGCELDRATVVAVPEGGEVTGLDFSLLPRGRVSGTVTRPDGTPLQSSTVLAFLETPGQLPGPFFIATAAVVDGAFTFDDLPAGDLYFLAADSPPYVGELWPGIPCQVTPQFLGCDPSLGETITIEPGSLIDGLEFRLNDGGAVLGRVETAAGETLVDHPVRLLGSQGEVIQIVETDVQGDFRFDGVGSGPVYAAAEGTATRVAELYRERPCWALGCDIQSGLPLGPAPGGFIANVDFSLDVGAALGGRVAARIGINPAGTGLAHQTVAIFAADGRQAETTMTDADGFYRFEGLPPGDYLVQASSDVFVTQAWNGVNDPGFVQPDGGMPVPDADPISLLPGQERTDIDFLLVQRPILEGRVTDRVSGDGLVVEVELYNAAGGLLESTTTSSEGDYRLEPPSEGPYWLVTRNDGVYEDQRWPGVPCINDPEVGLSCELGADGAVSAAFDSVTTDLDFALEIGGGLIVDLAVEGGGPVPDDAEGLLYTDADGLVARATGPQLAFPRLPSGVYFLVARATGYPDQVYRGEICGPLCEFPLSAGVSVDGLVRPAEPFVLRRCDDDCEGGELLVQQDRFRVTARFTDFEGTSGEATAVALTDDSGYFWFFRDTNVELVVKVLDACQAPFNRFWVFAAGLTNVEVEIEVVDLFAGDITRTYRNPLDQPFQPILDTDAFDTCAFVPPGGVTTVPEFGDVAVSAASAPHRSLFLSPFERALLADTPGAGLWKDGDCTAGEQALCLQAERFRVEMAWDTGSETGAGQAVPLTADTGYFWFFRDTNIEAVVKVLDACQPPFDRFWVFAAGLTDVGTTLRVTDTVTGDIREYSNPLGTAFQPVLDTDAFATCAAPVD